MRLDEISNGVFRASDESGLLMIDSDYHWLINVAKQSDKKRARVCFHKPDDSLHVMLIVLMKDTVVEPHSHKDCESQFLICGHGEIEIEGQLKPFDSINPLYFVRPGVVHRPIVKSDYMIVLESKGAE